MAIGERKTTAVTTTAKNIDFNADGGSVLVDLNIASSWDGTVDFQATIDGPNYFNIRYLKLGTLTPAESVSQLTSLATARYLLPGPLTQVRINCGAGTTGTLTAVYRIVPPGDGSALEVLVKEAVANGLIVQGPVASDSAEAGNPVPIGISVDETTPTAAGEGDVRRARGSAEGDLMVQPAFEGANISNASGIFAQGPIAHDTAQAGNPVQIGAIGVTTNPAAVNTGDVVRLIANVNGQLVIGATDANGNPDEGVLRAGNDGDNEATGGRGARVYANNKVYDPAGGNWDRMPGDSTGGVYVQGPAASDAAEVGNPLPVGGSVDDTSPTAAGEGDVRRARVSNIGDFIVNIGDPGKANARSVLASASPATGMPSYLLDTALTEISGQQSGLLTYSVLAGAQDYTNRWQILEVGLPDDGNADTARGLIVLPRGFVLAPDGSWDKIRSAGDAAPGLGAQNVAPIGGDITLRASAASGGTGTSTAVDNLGWIKSFLASLNVTVVSTGGAGTLDVWIQTQTALGTWTDILAFARVTTATIENLGVWGPVNGEVVGTQADAGATTLDKFFAIEAKALAASSVRHMALGDSLRVAWTETLNGDTGGFTFSVTIAAHA